MKNKIRVRFAPSPTGPLHIGGLRTALYNYLFAKKNNGKFILRIEDTDKKRLIKKSINYIINSLKWCKIKYNEGYKKGGIYKPYIQSKRINIYKKYIKILINKKFAYYCFEKKKNLLFYKKNNKNFIYNSKNRKLLNNSLNLKFKKKIKYYIKKKKYVIRLKTPKNKNITFKDKIYGKITINTNEIDDKVIFRSNNTPTYYLASVVDDYLMNITHIIRGREWLYSTPIHIIIYKYLKWKIPYFIHLPLILNEKNNKKISKRNYYNNNKLPIYPIKSNFFKIKNSFKEKGFLPESLFNIISLLGWTPPFKYKEILNIKNIIKLFDIKNINKSDLHINYKKICWINKNYIIKNKKKILFILNKYLKKIKKENKYNKEKKKKIVNLISKRLFFLNIKDIWSNSFYFFIKPKKYKIKIFNILNNNIKKKINKFLIKIIKLLLNNNKKKIIILLKKKTNIYLKILRISIVGDLKGINIIDIIYILKNKDIINRINFFIKKII